MSRHILNRYEQDDDGRFIIEVAVDRAQDLFEEFDRRAPYIKRDLDQDLVDYLIEAAEEIHPRDFLFRFTLAQEPTDDARDRVSAGVRSFFLALAALEARKSRQMWRRSGVLFGLGIALLFLSVWLNQDLGKEQSVVEHVFAEGLTVAAWMSMWESLAGIAIDWLPLRAQRRLYRLMARTPLRFQQG